MKKIFYCWICGVLALGLKAKAAGSHEHSNWSSYFDTHSLGAALSLVTTQQTDLNDHLESLGSPTSSFGNVYEMDVDYQYRFFDSMLAFQLRPTYFTQKSVSGNYDYDLSGFTIFPLLKMYVFETRMSRFFVLAGFGYGSVQGAIAQPTGKIEFEGNAWGGMAGIGTEFCSLYGHCLVLEADYRQLRIPKSEVKNGSGTIAGFSQYTVNRELETGGIDLETSMSGFIGRIGYQKSLSW